MKSQTVEDLMTRDTAVIRADADVHELEQRLLRDGIHGMPVIGKDETLVGVVSQTDLIAWHYFSESTVRGSTRRRLRCHRGKSMANYG